MTAQGMMQALAYQRPEDIQRRHLEYMDAREPLVKAMVRLVALARPRYSITLGSERIEQIDDGMTPEMRKLMQYLKDQDKALARSYGFDVKEPGDERIHAR